MHANAEYYLTVKELDRLIEFTTSKRDKALLTLFVDTGIRRFEAAQLLSSDVDFKAELVIIRIGKGRKLRMIPLSKRLTRELKTNASKSNPANALFRSKGHTLSIRQINRIVAKAGELAGIRNPNPRYKNITCHLIRHSFARHWKEAGGSIETLAKILGHSSVKTTWDMYGTQSIEDVKRNYFDTINKIATKGRNN